MVTQPRFKRRVSPSKSLCIGVENNCCRRRKTRLEEGNREILRITIILQDLNGFTINFSTMKTNVVNCNSTPASIAKILFISRQ